MENSDPVKDIIPSKELAWYLDDLKGRVTPEIRRLLEEYSKVPADEVLRHVHEIRDKAWAIRPYPCTGLGNFLQPTVSLLPVYPEILSRLKNGASFLDVGCFLGQDLRKLVFDGAPSDHLHGVDIVSHWHLGYELFLDEGRFKAHFMETDLLKPNAELSALEGKIDIIQVTHVLHQWGWKGQIQAAKQLAKYTKPGSLIVGYQAGTAGEATKEVGESEWHS
ncbi:hypothetical protein HYALB_00002904 [Hymenoscyphus albidus]|uniref:Methyltransferase domain-containing protein n=1 Tax=Hymenoscyphus albidus TaxID=595503 RepID=A0A9N9M032_9HELO|nr:hypothetical protein HYALB_00002904 [Hymenoscyphus albidus]